MQSALKSQLVAGSRRATLPSRNVRLSVRAAQGDKNPINPVPGFPQTGQKVKDNVAEYNKNVDPTGGPTSTAPERIPYGREQQADSRPTNAIEIAEENIPGLKSQIEPTVRPRAEEVEYWHSYEGARGLNLGQIFSFAGPLPETFNGRLAMLGFTWAMIAELYTGKPVFQQFREAPILPAGAFVVFLIATLVPLLRGVPKQDLSNGSFRFRNEIISGRAAMLGFAILVGLELLSGHNLFQQAF